MYSLARPSFVHHRQMDYLQADQTPCLFAPRLYAEYEEVSYEQNCQLRFAKSRFSWASDMDLPARKFRRARANASRSLFVGVNSGTARDFNDSYSASGTIIKSPLAKLLLGMVIAFIVTILAHFTASL